MAGARWEIGFGDFGGLGGECQGRKDAARHITDVDFRQEIHGVSAGGPAADHHAVPDFKRALLLLQLTAASANFSLPT